MASRSKNLQAAADRILSNTGQGAMFGLGSPTEPGEERELTSWRSIPDWLTSGLTGQTARENMERITRAFFPGPEGRQGGSAIEDVIGEVGFGGITSMPGRALRALAERTLRETREQGGTSIDPRTFQPTGGGTMVGGRVPGTELSLPAGTTTPRDIMQWMRESPVHLERDPWANIGGWPEMRGGKPYETFDISERVDDPREALLRAIERDERAVYNIDTGQEIFTPPGEVIRGATHRSHRPLGILSVEQAGTNPTIRGLERFRTDAPPKGYMGVPEVYRGEPGLGREFHTGDVGGIYNPAADPAAFERIKAQVGEQMRELGSRDPSTAATLLEQILMREGYRGMVQPRSGVIAMFEDVPLTYQGQLPPQYTGPGFGDLFEAEGGSRVGIMVPSEIRQRRLAQQAAQQQEAFPTPPTEPTHAPVSPLRPKTSTRTTVRSPERKEFPGIYQGPEPILEQAQAQWAPESPALRRVFGVSRADIDEAFREMERQADRGGLQFAPVTSQAADYPERVMGEANTRRLRDLLALSGSDPLFEGSYGWYWNQPLLDRYVELLGPEEGLRQWQRFHQQGAALSPRSDVPREILLSSRLNQLAREGTLDEALRSGQVPMLEKTHGVPLQRLFERGTPFTTDPLQAAKTKAYYGARTGENVWSPVMDAHFVRGIGLPDVRPGGVSDLRGSIGEREAGRVADWFARQVAAPVGQGGVGAQALQWNVLGPQTGVKTPLGAPFLELLADIATASGQRRGISGREALDEFILGRSDLY